MTAAVGADAAVHSLAVTDLDRHAMRCSGWIVGLSGHGPETALGSGGMIAKPTGVPALTSEGTQFIAFEDKRTLIAALATGFALGALIVSFTRPASRA